MEAQSITDDEASLLDTDSDDVYGLWEIDWWFNGRCPEWNKHQRIDLLSSLVGRQMVDVFFGKMGADLVPLPIESALAAVGNWDNWSPREPLDEPVYYVTTNDAGMAAFNAYVADR